MSLLHAIVLGLVQGLSEFLPISSSGHLELVPWLFGWDDFAERPELETSFDVALHIGTLAGAVAYFRRDLVVLARGGVLALRPARRLAGARPGTTAETGVEPAPGDPPARPGVADDGRLAWLLVLSAVPAALTGAALAGVVERLGEAEWLIGILLVAFGLVLLWADRLGGERSADRFAARDALFLGAAQALALAPGVSRSGVTMTAGRRAGFSRDAAARLAFLMSLPITAGAILYEAAGVVSDGGLPPGFGGPFAAGIATSAASGWVAVWGTLRLVRTRTFAPFVVYRVIVGVAVVAIAASSLR